MRSMKFIGILTLLVASLAATTAAQDPARLNFDRLNGLEAKALDVVEVNVDGKLLDLAKRVTTKLNDAEARTIGQAISGLRGVYVRVYNFEKDNEYDPAEVDAIRSQLTSPGWDKVANVRSRRNNQKIDIFTMFSGDRMDGVAVVMSDTKSVALVNVIGMIDIELLIELSKKGQLQMPKIDVEPGFDARKPGVKTGNEE